MSSTFLMPLMPARGGPVAQQLLGWDPDKSEWLLQQSTPHPAPTSGPIDLRLLTYNVWFDEASDITLRHRALAKLCFDTEQNEADIVCFQEIEMPAYELLLGIRSLEATDPLHAQQAQVLDRLRTDWLATSFPELQDILFGRYGTMILLRRSCLTRNKLSATAFVQTLASRYCRGLHYLELSDTEGIKLRIGTIHAEHDHATVRAGQLKTSVELLQQDGLPAVLMGDFNLRSTDELDALEDALEMKDAMRDIDDGPTFNTTYPDERWPTARIDIVLLSESIDVVDGKTIGDEAVEVPEGRAAPKKLGRDGKVFPSDHLGVYVRARLS